MLDVLAMQQQRPSGLVPFPDRHVDVGLVRVVMVDRDPLEPRPEIPLHGVQHPPSMIHWVESLDPLGRRDHLPHARIFGALPPIKPLIDLHLAPRSVEARPLVALPLGAIASQVPAMGGPAHGRLVRHVLELHDTPLLAGARAIAGLAERTALGTRTRFAMPDSCRDLAKKEPAAPAALGADAPQTDAPCAFRRFVTVVFHATVPSVRSRRREANVAPHADRGNPGPNCAADRRYRARPPVSLSLPSPSTNNE